MERPTTRVSGLFFGQMKIDHVGKCLIKNHTNGQVCVVEFVP